MFPCWSTTEPPAPRWRFSPKPAAQLTAQARICWLLLEKRPGDRLFCWPQTPQDGIARTTCRLCPSLIEIEMIGDSFSFFGGLLTVVYCPIHAGAGLGSCCSPVLQALDIHCCLQMASWDEPTKDEHKFYGKTKIYHGKYRVWEVPVKGFANPNIIIATILFNIDPGLHTRQACIPWNIKRIPYLLTLSLLLGFNREGHLYQDFTCTLFLLRLPQIKFEAIQLVDIFLVWQNIQAIHGPPNSWSSNHQLYSVVGRGAFSLFFILFSNTLPLLINYPKKKKF